MDCVIGFSLKYAFDLGLLEDSPKLKSYAIRVTSRDTFSESFYPPDRRPSGTLYHFPGSRSSRALFGAKLLNVNLNVSTVDVFKGETRTELYKSQTGGATVVPVLRTPTAYITESAAILLYLVSEQNKKSGSKFSPMHNF